MNRLVCVALTALALTAFGSGCCCMDRYYHGDCARPSLGGRIGQGGDCHDGSCADGCADGSCHSGAPAVGCHGGQCNPPTCGVGGCGPCNFHPLRALFSAINCSSGCGEFYFDEWINDPPDKCDPCDTHGGYVGQRACPPRWFLGGRHGQGDCGETGCGDAGCTTCGDGHGHDLHEGEVLEEVPLPQPEMIGPMPTAMRRSAKPYYNTPAPKSVRNVRSSGKPTPAVRRASHTSPTSAAKEVGSGVRTR